MFYESLVVHRMLSPYRLELHTCMHTWTEPKEAPPAEQEEEEEEEEEELQDAAGVRDTCDPVREQTRV